MNESIISLLDEYFYYSKVDSCIYCIDNDYKQIGYNELHLFIMKMFNINEDRSYGLVFNWLLDNDVPLIRQNWNRRFIRHNISIDDGYNQTITEDIDFKYVVVDD